VVADPRGPTIRRRRLAAELRRLRTIAELTLEQAANRLGDGWSYSKLSRVETARFGISAADLTSLLDLYQVAEHKRQPLLRLAHSARARGWWDAYAADLPAGYVSYIELESQATALRCFDAGPINGLLQTPDYARAVIGAGLMALSPPALAERRVDVRMIRQRLLTREAVPLRLSVVICEAALRRQAGRAALMRAQYQHLYEISKRRNVVLQILPETVGAHPALTGGFSIMEFAGEQGEAVVYLETLTGNLFVENDSEVYRYSLAFDHLAAAALTPAESAAYLGTLASADRRPARYEAHSLRIPARAKEVL
jgi:transcriptional regulator with XRE-family HTH domain